MKRVFVCAIVSLVLTGCGATARQEAKILETPDLRTRGNIITVPANLRAVELHIQRDSTFVSCSEPAPDVAVNNAIQVAMEIARTQKGSVSGKVDSNTFSADAENSMNGKATGSIATTAIELAGRTQIVLLAREFMYRNCISRANAWISNDDYQNNQQAIIRQISSLIRADSTKAEAEKAKANAAEAAVKGSSDKYEKALQYELKGFNSLLSKNLSDAVTQFDACENVYNRFHQAYEIRNYLASLAGDKVEWKVVYGKILSQYSWLMPSEIKDKMEKAVKDQTSGK